MARPRDPMALKVVRGKKHLTKAEVADGMASEIYASDGDVAPPDWLEGRALGTFLREAEYMRRVNREAGVNIYGSTDTEALATMVSAHERYLYYRSREESADSEDERQRCNGMKNKEAATYERYMRLLKLDPSSRVDFAGLKGPDGGGDDALANV